MNQDWNSGKYAKDAAFVSALGSEVVRLLNPEIGEHILDLGCGDGTIAAELVTMGSHVIGVDASESMVAAANKLGVKAHCISGEKLAFDGNFDAVFSNAALHWMQDYHAVLDGVFQALKPGGRFIAEMGGYGNVQVIRDAIHAVYNAQPDWPEYQSPWFFPSDEQYQTLLVQHGFQVNSITLFDRPTPLDSGVKEWLKLFAQHATDHLSAADKDDFLNQVVAHLKPRLYNDHTGWTADYVRLRFSATKPELN